MIKEKYKNHRHLIYRLSQLFYLKDIGFVNDLITDIIKDSNTMEEAKKIVIDILEYGMISNQIVVKNILTKAVYDIKNYDELSEIINLNFDKFLDLSNLEFPYKFDIGYTDYWKKELAKIGLWDREILKN